MKVFEAAHQSKLEAGRQTAHGQNAGAQFNDGRSTAGQLAQFQRMADHSPRTLQLRQMTALASGRVEPRNDTGMPAQLKAGIEALSGIDMSAVSVHRNSDKPAQLNAHAYAQDKQIHLGPGQERHLPHETWHVVQQAQGRVRSTATTSTGVAINDDVALEAEADRMGALALSSGPVQAQSMAAAPGELPPRSTDREHAAPKQLRAIAAGGGPGVVQRHIGFEYELGNVETYSKGPEDVQVALPKATVLATPPGFDVTADDPPTGSAPGAMSDLELITPPINENIATNRAVLTTTLQAVVAYLQVLRATPQETAVGGRFIGANEATDYDDGVLQATAGLSPGGLANLASGRTQTAAGVERATAETEKAALAREKWVWNRDGKNRAFTERINHAALQEFHAMGVTDTRLFESALMQLGALPAAQADLMAAVMSRIIAIPVAARSAQLPYPKSAAGALMARSDFATVIAALPVGVMANFATAAAFKTALLNAIRLALVDDAVQLVDTVFPAPVAGGAQLTLTLDDWFGGLYLAGAGKVDRLTVAEYPGGDAADPERRQLESLGSYGNRADPPTVGAVQRPIFEFRNLGSVTADSLVARGLAVWDLVRRANHDTEG